MRRLIAILRVLGLTILGLYAECGMVLFGQTDDEKTITLLFVGDIMMHDTQLAAAFNPKDKTYDFRLSFEHFKGVVESYDLAFGNLETTLGILPYSGYPNFSSPPQLAVDLKWTGFDVLTTANNHSADKLSRGLRSTLRTLDSLEIKHTGTFNNLMERDTLYPLLIEHRGFRLALLNYTYGTNGIALTEDRIVNMIDTLQMRLDVEKAKFMNPDAIIASMHWGDEYKSEPNATQIELAGFLTSLGVNLVIGSHPHVLQRMEWTNDTVSNHLVVYSLGNFYSGQRTAPRDGAAVVGVELLKNADGCFISDVHYRLSYVHYPTIGGIKRFMVFPIAEVMNDSLLKAPGGNGWGRMMEFRKGALKVMDANVNVKEMK